MMVPKFLHSHSYYSFDIIIIIINIITILIFSSSSSSYYYYYYYYFLNAYGNCVCVVLVINTNVLLVYKKLGTIIFNNLRF